MRAEHILHDLKRLNKHELVVKCVSYLSSDTCCAQREQEGGRGQKVSSCLERWTAL